ncbi:MAG: ATP-binding cassette domain-containing protein [Candidatus Dormibacteraeota bacterium]|uniref:ATP-binding cassette domain-containing protein n=1 Tax=Candidatus Aeolococcus gillhamiae TaxID=3127015 RepID=A0A2W5ZEE2_9BACT|nr:ATP-binding cassette domain-containing protein [Candidatus Dormibacteraeota bacterium]PZR83780.1 MAG: daunorubicin/doxorubicin resistance ABC transporter ATP-binding protein DrrA [Candidatus Dormibacter sp. RRmetagenome_bin12]
MNALASDNHAIRVEGLHKAFGKVQALRGIDFAVPRGSVLGVLGPNGAGKTTAVRILSTLLRPDSGTASIEGHDVVRDAAAVRRVIALAGQATAIQVELTGRENLDIMGRLRHLERNDVRARTADLLERFDLVDAADRPAKTYSGGMKRRLDLAASLMGDPAVLFLDEPTTGLDPYGRLGMWDVIRQLAAQGTTILLTTQYLDEADELADDIIVIERGQVIAQGTSDQLKDRVGGDVLEFTVVDRDLVARAVEAVAGLTDTEPRVNAESRRVALQVGSRGSHAIVDAVRRLDAAGVETDGLALHRPSLDDVFLAVTGHAAESEDGAVRGRGRRPAAQKEAAER